MRITWLTDLHLNFLEDGQIDAFYARVRAEQPDIVLVSGDTGEGTDVLEYIDALARIARVYFVMGNHDYYRSSIREVRQRAGETGCWLPAIGPVQLTPTTVLVGVDGWGDARCGNLQSRIRLSDWSWIEELNGLGFVQPAERAAALNRLGDQEAAALRAQLATLDATSDVLVLTHVPPFAEACWYDGHQSEPDWLPWFTCVAVGDVVRDFAEQNPARQITVLCGHSHGQHDYRAAENLRVRTGGWPPGAREYGNPLVQKTWEIG